jgi:hypothetical protein
MAGSFQLNTGNNLPDTYGSTSISMPEFDDITAPLRRYSTDADINQP